MHVTTPYDQPTAIGIMRYLVVYVNIVFVTGDCSAGYDIHIKCLWRPVSLHDESDFCRCYRGHLANPTRSVLQIDPGWPGRQSSTTNDALGETSSGVADGTL